MVEGFLVATERVAIREASSDRFPFGDSGSHGSPPLSPQLGIKGFSIQLCGSINELCFCSDPDVDSFQASRFH